MQRGIESSNVSNPPLDPFAELVQALRQSFQPPVTTSLPTASASPMAQPATYSGEAEESRGFLWQCLLFFEMLPQLFHNDRVKIVYPC